jgi:predicted hotdog family 3-hydroxylacyl-ACP dehydratase
MMAGSLLPHSGSALLLTRMVRHGDGALDAEAMITSNYALATNGKAPAVVAIEIGAQAAGALEALTGAGGDAPRGGRLVRVEAATFHLPSLPTGSIIDVRVERDALLPPLARYRVTVTAAGSRCADCTISIFLLG